MNADWYFERLREHGSLTAIVFAGRELTYAALLAEVDEWARRLDAQGVCGGDVVAVVSDYSPASTAALLALARLGAIVVPLSVESKEKLDICCARFIVGIEADGRATFVDRATAGAQVHPLIARLRADGHPGLVLFTSGSTGTPKGLLIDFVSFLERFRRPRPALRTLTLLMFDHIGGLSTLFGVLAYGGTAVMPSRDEFGRGQRGLDPSVICALVEKHRAELIPGSPTFIRMMLMADVQQRFDLSSLKVITYGTEPMYPATLRDACAALPAVVFKQTYGSSELGILQTRTLQRDSLWVSIGGPMVETKVVDGRLRVRTPTSMMGYLNAPSPFDAEGWYDTGDLVEQDGDRFLIRGRASEIINVGGEKVFPAEVEEVLMQAPNIADVTVYGKESPVMGHVVAARVRTVDPEDIEQLADRLQEFCRDRLSAFKIPLLVSAMDGVEQINGKKRRAVAPVA